MSLLFYTLLSPYSNKINENQNKRFSVQHFELKHELHCSNPCHYLSPQNPKEKNEALHNAY
jgi:hypothetical protein